MANPLIPPMDPTRMPPSPFESFASMPPPPPSPSLGFSLWAQDPQNAMKVMPSMTAPDQPLQPGAGKPMASANPPAVTSPLTPPRAEGINPAGATMPPPQNPAQTQLGTDSAELQRLQNNGPGVNQIKSKPLRILGKIGDIAGSILAPGVSTFIPGTTMHNEALRSRAQNAIGRDQATIQAQNQQAKDAADLAHVQAETKAIPINTQIKQQQANGNLAQHGLKLSTDDQGNVTGVVPDEDSPVYQQQQQKEETLKAQADYMQAGIALRNAQADLAKSKNDPNSPAFKMAQQKLVVAQQNADAAGQRAKAYWGRYLQSAYNVGLGGETLAGAPQITDDNGGTAVVGTANASQAVKSQANVAQFNDIEGATNNIEQAATNLVNKGGKLNSPEVAAAIADPKSTSGQWAQGEFATSGLTPEQRDYVVQVKAYKENLQSLRKSAGGGVSDSQVDRLMSLAPGAGTPDLDYLKRQTAQIRQMRGRLATGVTTVKGGLGVAGNPLKPPAAAPPKGATHIVPGSDGKNHYTDGKNDLGVAP